MTEHPISKLEAARRQLDMAIKLLFNSEDSLSVHTLAYASFKILFDLYTVQRYDDFGKQLDKMISVMGWQRFNKTANFLKHAERDPDEILTRHDVEESVGIIGLAIVMYYRTAGDFTPLMRGFDCWIESLYPEDFDIPPDPDPAREEFERKMREAIKAGPLADRLAHGKQLTELLAERWNRDGKQSGLESLQEESPIKCDPPLSPNLAADDNN